MVRPDLGMIFSKILGYGLSGDGHHITAGRSDGRGAYLAMRGSLKYFRDSAAFCPDLTHELCCINAHATSTPLGDLAEVAAIQTLLKDIQVQTSRTRVLNTTKKYLKIRTLIGCTFPGTAVFRLSLTKATW